MHPNTKTFIICITVSMVLSAYGCSDSKPTVTLENSETRLSAIARAYPQFGGMYLCGDQLCVVTTESNNRFESSTLASVVEKLIPARIQRSEIKLVRGKFTYAQLESWKKKIRNAFSIPGVVSIDNSEVKNKITVGIRQEESAEEVRQLAKELNIPSEAIAFRQEGPGSFLTTLDDRFRPVAGGIKINYDDNGPRKCTLGFPVRYEYYSTIDWKSYTKYGFMTNSHCTGKFGGVLQGVGNAMEFEQPANWPVGREFHNPTPFTGGDCPENTKCRWSDAAIVEYTDQAAFHENWGRIARPEAYGSKVIDSDKPVFWIDGQVPYHCGDIWIGDRFNKVGIVTGLTFGTVTESCVDRWIETDDDGDGILLLCQHTVRAADDDPNPIVDYGDSGSPVFWGQDPVHNPEYNRAELYGILWGGPTDPEKATREYWFSDIGCLDQEMGGIFLSYNPSPNIPSDPSDPVEFTDTAFEAAVREAIGKPTGTIGYDDVSGLKSLNTSSAGISDISGIQCFTGLTSLHLHNNQIADLTPLSELTALTTLSLGNNQIVDLQPLSGLTALTELWLGDNQIVDIQPLSGLTSLTYLGLNINQIVDITPLVDNSGLDSGDRVFIRDNSLNCEDQASNIAALRDRGVSLETDCMGQLCTGDYTIDSVNTSSDLAAVEWCDEIEGSLRIKNTTLSSLAGLEHLTNVGGGLSIDNNDSLTSLDALGSLTNVGGYLYINNNDSLTSIEALGSLTSVGGGSLFINSNASLTSLSGLENLTNVGGGLSIIGNGALKSLTGLGSLTNVGGYLRIIVNGALTSLAGLEGVETIGECLEIRSNKLLADVSALHGVTDGPQTSDASVCVDNALVIKNNYALPSCEAENLAATLGEPCFCSGNNGSGCSF